MQNEYNKDVFTNEFETLTENNQREILKLIRFKYSLNFKRIDIDTFKWMERRKLKSNCAKSSKKSLDLFWANGWVNRRHVYGLTAEMSNHHLYLTNFLFS